MPAPIRFHQVKDQDTIKDICEKFNVSPHNIEREHPDKPELVKGEMLVIKLG
jgi:hypothetical protein